MNKNIYKISKYSFYGGILVAAYGLYKIYIDRRGLPLGACPIENNRPIMYIGIALLVISLVLDFVGDFEKRKND